jgi:hypothetical protein
MKKLLKGNGMTGSELDLKNNGSILKYLHVTEA